MSLYGALFSGVSGLAAQSSAMGAISDNITNVNTIGYKGAKVNFKTLVTKQVSSTNYAPGGVQSAVRKNVDIQGLLQATNSATDVAMSGQGFFVVNEAASPQEGDMYAYTRAGSFKVDREGYLQNVSGWYMQGWPLMAWDNSAQASTVTVGNNVYMKAFMNESGDTSYINDNIVSSTHLRPLNLNEVGGTASQTRNLRMGANLPNGAAIGKVYKQPVTIYDSLGTDSTVQFSWTKNGQNRWDLEAIPPEGAKSMTLKSESGGIYGAMGRLDFNKTPAAGGYFSMDINGNTWRFNAATGTDGSTANYLYADPTSSSFVSTMASQINRAFQVEYNSQTTATQDDILASGSTIRIQNDAGVPTDTTINCAGMSLTDVKAQIDALSLTLTVTVDETAGTIQVVDNAGADGTSYTITGAGGLSGVAAAAADGADTGVAAATRIDDAFGEGSTVTIGGTTYTLAGITATAAVAAINADTDDHGVAALNNGGSLVLYTAGSNDVTVTGAGDFAAIGDVVGTAGKTYAEMLAGTDSIIFRQFGTADADQIVVGNLDHLLASDNNPATLQGQDPDLLTGFTVDNLTMDYENTDALVFNGDGTPATINVANIAIDWANGSIDMADDAEIGVFLGNLNIRDGMTQLDGDYQLAYWSQNGAKFGNFAGVSIGSDGIVTALFDNGVTRPVFQIPVATFTNPGGMDSLSGNVFISTDNSGEPTLRTAGSAGAGQMAAASLEASTVDIGEEFTTMIVTQRAYSAAAKIITTADEMLDELVRIKR